MQRITQEELSALIMDNKDGMYRLAFSILRNDADAQDAVSEAIVLAFEKCHKLRKRSSAKSWLMQILVNSSKKIAVQSNKYVLLENEIQYEQAEEFKDDDMWETVMKLDEETGEQYEVSVDLQNAKAGSVAKIAAESPYEDNLKPDEALYKSQYETADKMASAFLGNTEAWKDSKITYLVSDDGSVRNGVVNYEFTAQSEESCIVSYSQSLGQMYKVRYFTEEVNIYTDCFSGYNKEIR